MIISRRQFIAAAGGVLALGPTGGWAQQESKKARIAFVHPAFAVNTLNESGDNPWRAFFSELRSLGYVEGKNLVIERVSGTGISAQRYGELAREALNSNPDLIVTGGFPSVQLLMATTNTTPIVAMVNDPVATGLVASLARPGGNLTGVVVDAGLELWEKRFQLLREVIPSASAVGFLLPRDFWDQPYSRSIRQSAERLGITLTLVGLGIPIEEQEIKRAFANLREQQLAALVINEGPVTLTHSRLIVQLAQDARLPALYPYREFVDTGGLMAYSVDLRSLTRHAAHQVDQILKGAAPAEIPFLQATNYHLSINLKTAKALDLTVPSTLLARADEVIE
jgi:putative ABC transport system substrate-binding protein